jgi:hypothetical protein
VQRREIYSASPRVRVEVVQPSRVDADHERLANRGRRVGGQPDREPRLLLVGQQQRVVGGTGVERGPYRVRVQARRRHVEDHVPLVAEILDQ